jgi:hypothetical protein
VRRAAAVGMTWEMSVVIWNVVFYRESSAFQYKMSKLAGIIELIPKMSNARIILLGDCTEADAEVYNALSLEHGFKDELGSGVVQ